MGIPPVLIQIIFQNFRSLTPARFWGFTCGWEAIYPNFYWYLGWHKGAPHLINLILQSSTNFCWWDNSFCFFLQHGYGSIPIDTFLVGWTSIYQLFWGSLGTRVLTHPHMNWIVKVILIIFINSYWILS